MVALVEIDEAGACESVGMADGDLALENVLVFAAGGDGGIGTGDVEEVAKFGEEELVVGAFGRAGILPSLDEGVNGHGGDGAMCQFSGWGCLSGVIFSDEWAEG